MEISQNSLNASSKDLGILLFVIGETLVSTINCNFYRLIKIEDLANARPD